MTDPLAPLKRPELTLPPDEAECLRQAYAAAGTILEYGTGGSTIVAGELGRTIFAVESDAAWCAGLQRWFDANPPAGRVVLHHADIGPTGGWGTPTSAEAFGLYPGYAQSVWDRPDFQAPDTVMVDGRFRVACFATAFLRSEQPVTLLFDDYVERPHYHVVERLAKPARFAGRMAVFALQPAALPRAEMGWIASAFADPR